MTLKLITPPAIEPVTLAEAKAHLRCGDDEDSLITALIQTAREECEHRTERSLITQTWERVLDFFPPVEIELGRPPVQSIVSITYYDAAGALQTMDSADYSLDVDLKPGWVSPAYGTVWPNTYDMPNAVRVRFLAGYGDTAADVPATSKAWMLLRIGTLYKHRESTVVGVPLSTLPSEYVNGLLDAIAEKTY